MQCVEEISESRTVVRRLRCRIDFRTDAAQCGVISPNRPGREIGSGPVYLAGLELATLGYLSSSVGRKPAPYGDGFLRPDHAV